jgi:hypothetical protein
MTLLHGFNDPHRHSPSPLVGEGREGGTHPKDARAATSSEPHALVAIPPSPTLPHKGGGGRFALSEIQV